MVKIELKRTLFIIKFKSLLYVNSIIIKFTHKLSRWLLIVFLHLSMNNLLIDKIFSNKDKNMCKNKKVYILYLF